MVKRFLISLTLLILGSYGVSIAQDAHFSQFYANPLYLNPAFAGSERCPRLSLAYRNQWPAFGSTYVTYNMAYDQYWHAIRGGIGINLINDVQGCGDGKINLSTINAMYSYTLQVSKNFSIAAGFQATFAMKRIDWDFVFPDMIHPLYGPIYSTMESSEIVNADRNYVDFSAGVIGFTERVFFGVAVHHLTEPSESFLRGSDAVLPRKYTAHFGTEIPINSSKFKRGELLLAPQILFQQQGAFFQQFYWGMYVSRKGILAGFWFRQTFEFQYDAFVMMVGYKYNKFRVAYSYDLTISKLSNSTYGAHEISVAYTFGCHEKAKKMSTISCPSF